MKRRPIGGKKNGKANTSEETPREEEKKVEEVPPPSSSLADASEEELVRELARRRAERFRLAGAMGRLNGDDEPDPTGQVCSLNGGNGTIPCRELME